MGFTLRCFKVFNRCCLLRSLPLVLSSLDAMQGSRFKSRFKKSDRLELGMRRTLMPRGRCRELRTIVSSPKNGNEHARRAHRAKGETFPSLGRTACAAGFPPECCANLPSADCRKRNEFTIPDSGETLCRPLKPPNACADTNGFESFRARLRTAREIRASRCVRGLFISAASSRETL